MFQGFLGPRPGLGAGPEAGALLVAHAAHAEAERGEEAPPTGAAERTYTSNVYKRRLTHM